MVRLAPDGAGHESVKAQVVDQILASSAEYRKRPRSSLDYHSSSEDHNNVLPPTRSRPPLGRTERGSVQEPLSETPPKEKPKRSMNSRRRSRANLQDQLLDDLKKDGVPVFQWVMIVALLLLGAYQLRKTLSIPSAKNSHRAKVHPKAKSKAKAKSRPPALKGVELEGLLEEDHAAPKNEPKGKKVSKKKKKKAKTPSKATSEKESPPKQKVSDTTAEVVDATTSRTVEKHSDADENSKSIKPADPDAVLAQQLHDLETMTVAEELSTEENEWAEVSSRKKKQVRKEIATEVSG